LALSSGGFGIPSGGSEVVARPGVEHHSEIGVPFSAEALAYARRLARQQDRFPDDRRALAELSSAGTPG
jgi:hypothetical protein